VLAKEEAPARQTISTVGKFSDIENGAPQLHCGAQDNVEKL
jgi:hypothetical protein